MLPAFLSMLPAFLSTVLVAMLVISPSADAGALDRSLGDRGSLRHVFATAPVSINPVGVVPHGDGYRVWAGADGDLGRFEYRAGGSLDPALDGRGFRLIEPIAAHDDDWDVPRAVALQGNREIIAGGVVARGGLAPDEWQTLARFQPDGTIDREFGNRGTVVSRDLHPAVQVAVDGNGRILTLARKPQKGRPPSKRFRPAGIEIARFRPDGSRDQRFGKNGVVRRSVGLGTRAGALAADPDGKVLASFMDEIKTDDGRREENGRVMRLDSSGRIDRFFGDYGTARLGSGYRRPRRMTPTGTGGLLVAALDRNDRAHALAFDRQGRPDTAFGTGGDATVATRSTGGEWGALHGIRDMAVFADGMIAVSGKDRLGVIDRDGAPLPVPDSQLPGRGAGVLFAAADGSLITVRPAVGSPAPGRLLPGLTADPSYRANAAHRFDLRKSVTGWFDAATGMSDRGFLLAGPWPDLTSPADRWKAATPAKGSVRWLRQWVRLRPDGQLDPKFGENGMATEKKRGADNVEQIEQILPRPGGRAWGFGPLWRKTLAIRMDRRGVRDSFQLKAFRRQGFHAATSSPGGKVLAFGTRNWWRLKEGPGWDNYWWDVVKEGFLLARYKADGSPDRSFGRGGVVRTFFPENSGARAAVIDGKGRITVAGGTCGEYSNCSLEKGQKRVITVARYLRNGRLDRSFGRRGYVQVPAGGIAGVKSMARLKGGRVAISIDGSCGPLCFNLSRLLVLNRDGSLDRGFGRRGRLHLRLGRSFEVFRVRRARNGGMMLAGTLESCRGRPEFALIRLERHGRFDRRFGGGDGILDSGVRGGIGASTYLVSSQKKGTLTLGGYAEVKGRYGGVEPAFGMVRFRLDGKDGRTPVRPCRI